MLISSNTCVCKSYASVGSTYRVLWIPSSTARHEDMSSERGLAWARYSMPTHATNRRVGSVHFESDDTAAGRTGKLSVQASALRGHCLKYCQRDRADYLSSVSDVVGLVSRCVRLKWFALLVLVYLFVSFLREDTPRCQTATR